MNWIFSGIARFHVVAWRNCERWKASIELLPNWLSSKTTHWTLPEEWDHQLHLCRHLKWWTAANDRKVPWASTGYVFDMITSSFFVGLLPQSLAWLIYRECFGRAIIRWSDWSIDWLIGRLMDWLTDWSLSVWMEFAHLWGIWIAVLKFRCFSLFNNLFMCNFGLMKLSINLFNFQLFMFVSACWKRFRYGVLVYQRIGERRAAGWGGWKRRQGRAGSEAHWTPSQAAWLPTGSLHHSSRRRSSVVWGKGPSLVPQSAAGWDWPVHPTVAGEICRRGTAGRYGHAGWLAQTDWGKHSSDAETCLCVAGGCADDEGRECHAVSHVAGTRNFFSFSVLHFANQQIKQSINQWRDQLVLCCCRLQVFFSL